MTIEHVDAISLVQIVKDVYNCENGGVGGLVNSDIFKEKPYYSAVLALSPLYLTSTADIKEVTDFFYKYYSYFDKPQEDYDEYIVSTFIKELSNLVLKYY